MSNRRTDNNNVLYFSSDRFFFANGAWYYYVRTYDNTMKTIGDFPTKVAAMDHCQVRFTDDLDFYNHHIKDE